jgi:hypothetical protein
MVTHHVLVAETVHAKDTIYAAVIRVTRASDLPAALAQHEEVVVIDDDKIARQFSRIEYWQEARWWFIAALVYRILTTAITNQYQIDAEWHLNWKVITLGGHVTLTPTPRTIPNSDPGVE